MGRLYPELRLSSSPSSITANAQSFVGEANESSTAGMGTLVVTRGDSCRMSVSGFAGFCRVIPGTLVRHTNTRFSNNFSSTCADKSPQFYR